jgi:hypothetical protein
MRLIRVEGALAQVLSKGDTHFSLLNNLAHLTEQVYQSFQTILL